MLATDLTIHNEFCENTNISVEDMLWFYGTKNLPENTSG